MSPRKTVGWRPVGRDRRDYRLDGAPMLFLAFGLLNAGVGALLNAGAASATSVAQVLPEHWQSFELFWQLSYVLAGIALMVGVLRPWPVVEVLGEWLAIWAMFVNLLALVLLRGPAGTGTSLGAFMFAIAICVARIHTLHRRAHRDRRNGQHRYTGLEKRRG